MTKPVMKRRESEDNHPSTFTFGLMFSALSKDHNPMKTGKVSRQRIKKDFLLVLISFLCFSLAAQSDENQSIAPELVGKWCFMNISGSTADVLTNSCLTLNADGSFEAVLDRTTLANADTFSDLQNNDTGKWWVQGNQLFYNSAANGTGSYSFQKINHPRLQNTPMIVIGGIAFVAAGNHDPW